LGALFFFGRVLMIVSFFFIHISSLIFSSLPCAIYLVLRCFFFVVMGGVDG
jgi:hypothetical protein